MKFIYLTIFTLLLFSCQNTEQTIPKTKIAVPEIKPNDSEKAEPHIYPEEDLNFNFISPEEIETLNEKVLKEKIKMPEDIVKFHRPKSEQTEGNYSYKITRRIDDKLRIELTLIEEGLLDDSQKSRKSIYTMNMKDNRLIVIGLKEQYKCQKGRGQEQWGAELCL